MISKEEIKNLADFSRIDIKDEEAEKLSGEIEGILQYVGQVKSVIGEIKEGVDVGILKNIMREDSGPTEPGFYSKELIAEFPEREGDYLKVKKIL